MEKIHGLDWKQINNQTENRKQTNMYSSNSNNNTMTGAL